LSVLCAFFVRRFSSLGASQPISEDALGYQGMCTAARREEEGVQPLEAIRQL
jgi:hypothetical protein